MLAICSLFPCMICFDHSFASLCYVFRSERHVLVLKFSEILVKICTVSVNFWAEFKWHFFSCDGQLWELKHFVLLRHHYVDEDCITCNYKSQIQQDVSQYKMTCGLILVLWCLYYHNIFETVKTNIWQEEILWGTEMPTSSLARRKREFQRNVIRAITATWLVVMFQNLWTESMPRQDSAATACDNEHACDYLQR
jgi:hypothetical protein